MNAELYKSKSSQFKMLKLNSVLFLSLVLLLSFSIFPNVSAILSCPTTAPYCSALAPNSYFQCNQYTGNTVQYACPSGQTCSGGSCVSPVQATANTNGVTCPSGTTNYYCSSLKPTSLFRCVNGVTNEYTCGTGQVCSNSGSGAGCVDKYTSYCAGVVNQCNSGYTGVVTSCNTKTGLVTTKTCSAGTVCSGGNCVGVNSPSAVPSVTTCPSGTTNPYCSPVVGDTNYLKCVNGVTTTYSCRSGTKCSDGSACFYEGIFPSGDTLTDVVSQVGSSAGGSVLGSLGKTFLDNIFNAIGIIAILGVLGVSVSFAFTVALWIFVFVVFWLVQHLNLSEMLGLKKYGLIIILGILLTILYPPSIIPVIIVIGVLRAIRRRG